MIDEPWKNLMSKIIKDQVTFEDVVLAACHLVEKGENPTQSAVRKIIGSGSFVFISKALAQWKMDCYKRYSSVNSYRRGCQDTIRKIQNILDDLYQ
jgi:hypothetical protein